MHVCLAFFVLAATTFSLHTQETPDYLSCCKKLPPLNRRLLSFQKQQKPMVCQKVHLKFYTHIVKR